MTTTDKVSITALAVGLVFVISGMALAFADNPAGIWVMVAGVVLFAGVKFTQNFIVVRRALRKNRLQ